MQTPLPPPPVLEGARLLAYAIVDNSVSYSGRSTLYIDGKLLGAVPCLAICQDETEAVLLFFCDEKWNARGVVECLSLVEAQRRAESEYSGLSTKWIAAKVSEEDAARYLDEHSGTQRCSFCGKSPNEVSQIFAAAAANICDGCIREFYQDLDETPTD